MLITGLMTLMRQQAVPVIHHTEPMVPVMEMMQLRVQMEHIHIVCLEQQVRRVDQRQKHPQVRAAVLDQVGLTPIFSHISPFICGAGLPDNLKKWRKGKEYER